jgi:hypothetical protein
VVAQCHVAGLLKWNLTPSLALLLPRSEAATVSQLLLELPFVPLEPARLRMCTVQAQQLHPALLDRLPRVRSIVLYCVPVISTLQLALQDPTWITCKDCGATRLDTTCCQL